MDVVGCHRRRGHWNRTATELQSQLRQGEIFRNRVQVLFTGYELAPPDSGCPTTFRYYSQLIVAYPDLTEIPDGLPGPYMPFAGTDTKYNGMPAVRYNDLEIICNSPQA